MWLTVWLRTKGGVKCFEDKKSIPLDAEDSCALGGNQNERPKKKDRCRSAARSCSSAQSQAAYRSTPPNDLLCSTRWVNGQMQRKSLLFEGGKEAS